jgi:hypothetical protein
VSVAATGREHLRFDVFDGEPHYHYIHYDAAGAVTVNNVVYFDTTAHGEMLPWVLDTLRRRMGALLDQAGAGIDPSDLGPTVLGPAIDRIAELAAKAQETQRASRC